MTPRSSIPILTLFTIGGVAGSFSFAGEVSETADAITLNHALGSIAAQSEILGVLSPAPNFCGMIPAPPPEGEPEVGVYECAFSPDDGPTADVSPAPSSLPSDTAPRIPRIPISQLPDPARYFQDALGSFTFATSTGNDNYPGHMKGTEKNAKKFDFGHTFDWRVYFSKVLGTKGFLGRPGDRIGFEAGTVLISQEAMTSLSTYNGLIEAQRSANASGIPVKLTGVDGQERSVYLNAITYSDPNFGNHQQSLNENYVKAFKEWNRKHFTILGEVSFASRNTTGNSFGDRTQDGWHSSGVGANYVLDNVDMMGKPGTWTATTIGQVQRLAGPTVDLVDVKVTPDILPNMTFAKYGKWVLGGGVTVEKKSQFFRGSCELVTSGSVQLGLQGGDRMRSGAHLTLDPNSKVKVGSDFKAAVVKNRRWGDPKVVLSTGAAVVYYPKVIAGPNFDSNANAGVQLNSHLGKGGTILRTSVVYEVPGVGDFRGLNDNDPIVSLKFALLLHGKKHE